MAEILATWLNEEVGLSQVGTHPVSVAACCLYLSGIGASKVVSDSCAWFVASNEFRGRLRERLPFGGAPLQVQLAS